MTRDFVFDELVRNVELAEKNFKDATDETLSVSIHELMVAESKLDEYIRIKNIKKQ